MKETLKETGVSVAEMAMLLLLPEQTLHTWFNRNSNVPMKYQQYLWALTLYQAQRKPDDLAATAVQWAAKTTQLREKNLNKTINNLEFELLQATHTLERLKAFEQKLVRRLHLAEHFSKYLSPEEQGKEEVLIWLNLIAKRSEIKMEKTCLNIEKLELKLAGVVAQLSYCKGRLAV